jgi:hypothetical protein
LAEEKIGIKKIMKRKDDSVFKSRVSHWIAGLYWAIVIFLCVMLIGIPLVTPMPLMGKTVFVITFVVVLFVIVYTLFRAYQLSFVITSNRLLIGGLLKKHEVLFSDIKEIEKIPIPFGFRLFGASFLGGRYYFPGVGNATVAMSNFDDGVLITTKKGYNFVITPLNPLKFIDTLKKQIT